MLARGSETITDGIISLREISRSDSKLLYTWRMDASSRTMFRDTAVAAFDFHLSVIERYLNSDSLDCWFLIEVEGGPVGTLSLYNFTEGGRVCEWGRFVIAPEARNRGYGRRALKLLMAYARSAGVKRMKCEVLATNGIALHLYCDLGFAQSGVHDHDGRNFLTMTADLDAQT